MELARWKEPLPVRVSPTPEPADASKPFKAWTDHRVELRAWGVDEPWMVQPVIQYWALIHLRDNEIIDEKRFDTQDEAVEWWKHINADER